MPPTLIRGKQVLDGSIQRADLDVTTVGQAVVAKLIQGTNITLSSTGGDAGTGDVTISAASGGTGPAGANSWTLSSASFTVPVVGATAVMSVNDTSWATVGEYVWVQSSPTVSDALQITAKTSTSLTLLNPPTAGVHVSGDAGNMAALGSDSLVYVPDAPADSKLYGRKNSAWSVVSTGISSPGAGNADFDDFEGSLINAGTSTVGKLGWLVSNGSGGGGWVGNTPAISSTGVDATNKAFGIWRCTCNTSTSSGGAFYLPGGQGNSVRVMGSGMFPGLGVFTVEWRVSLDQLNTSANDCLVQFGIGATTGGSPAALNDGIYFETSWANNGNAHWWLVCNNNGTKSKSDTGVNPSLIPAYDKLSFTTNAGWTSVQATVNGTAAGSPITTNFPVVAISPGMAQMMCTVIPSGTRLMYVDYYYRNYQYTR